MTPPIDEPVGAPSQPEPPKTPQPTSPEAPQPGPEASRQDLEALPPPTDTEEAPVVGPVGGGEEAPMVQDDEAPAEPQDLLLEPIEPAGEH